MSVSGKLQLTEDGHVRCANNYQLHLKPQSDRLPHKLVLKHLPSRRTALPSQGVAKYQALQRWSVNLLGKKVAIHDMLQLGIRD